MASSLEQFAAKLPHQPEAIAQIFKMLAEIKFGSVEITIHDSKITQIERKEKVRPATDKS